MLKLAIALIAGAAGGFLAGTLAAPGSAPAAPTPEPVAAYFDESAPVDERLAALERIVGEERNARLVLEEQIMLLLEEIDRIDSAGPDVLSSQISEFQAIQERRQAAVARRANETRGLSARERQLAALTAGGFPPDRANQILDRLSALQFELMQEGYEARNGGAMPSRTGLEANPDWRLRQELGDAEYEQYLDAMGRPTEIAVQEVMASSPASRAGLASGDVIVSYNGTRIFNSAELRSFAMSGSPGTDVVVEILRDGNTMQLTLPAGPMGIQMGPNRAGRSRTIRN